MKLTFLHISDLHFRPNWPEECDLVLAALTEDLRSQLPNFENVYTIFSGDLVQAGGQEDIYAAFLQKLGLALTELGLPKAKRICVPGNHDVSRTALEPKITIQKGALAEIQDEELFNRNFAQLSKMLFAETFAPYVSAEAVFAQFACCQENLGGHGWELNDEVGIYCLNSALCSFGGLNDPNNGQSLPDKDRLLIYTRPLHQWIQQNKSTFRILVMHHPPDWLGEWAKIEIENAISESFRLVFSGHIHRGSALFSTRGSFDAVHLVAPALFTRKRDELGYSIIECDTESGSISVVYRQKSARHKFVAGTGLANNNTGVVEFQPSVRVMPHLKRIETAPSKKRTLAVLTEEFDESCTCYSSKRRIWVDRDLATKSELADEKKGVEFITPLSLARSPRSCIIRGPKGFGLSCLGAFLSLQHHREAEGMKVLPVCDTTQIPHHRQGVLRYITDRCATLGASKDSVEGLILDNWLNDQNANKILRIITEEFPKFVIIVLQGFEDFSDIANAMTVTGTEGYKVYYLWSLKRAHIRQLVSAYIEQSELALDENVVTHKIIDDIDALNIHRTPLNCLLILKLVESSFDDSPVNRTEVISKVLYFLFHEFDDIPRYATRPDLKDCEFALGFLCEWMIRESKSAFTRDEFLEKVREYCVTQMISLDADVLFSFLATENILIRRGLQFAFRLTYWLYYFAAHRMHHNGDFASFIFENGRYASFPEMIEFYTGIDRRRTDAVTKLAADLRTMDAQFLARTKIPGTFNPLAAFLWTPSKEAIEALQQSVTDSIQESALPASVKDAIADAGYDNAKPYRQEVNEFIARSTVQEMLQAMRGAARALRNSDHVDPGAKRELLEAVLQCWVRVCQIIIVVSPLLAANRTANFENIGFFWPKVSMLRKAVLNFGRES